MVHGRIVALTPTFFVVGSDARGMLRRGVCHGVLCFALWACQSDVLRAAGKTVLFSYEPEIGFCVGDVRVA